MSDPQGGPDRAGGPRAARAPFAAPRSCSGSAAASPPTRPSSSAGCLVDAGAHVVPVLTASATRFVGAATFSALASEPARVDFSTRTSPIPHTDLAPARRPRRDRAGDGPRDRLVRGRDLLRPARGDAARHPGPRACLPGDAHRDVGARRGERERRHLAQARASTCSSRTPAASPAGTSGPGRLPEPGRIVAGGGGRSSPKGREAGPGAVLGAHGARDRRAAPASRSTRSATSRTAPRGARATPSRRSPPSSAPRSCS